VAEVAIHDADAFMRDHAPKVAGARTVWWPISNVRQGDEGNVPQRFVIIAFDRARGLYDSPAYQQLVPIRLKTAPSTLFIAEGHPR
jgi:uncharacterized protein (DUF1330 family)